MINCGGIVVLINKHYNCGSSYRKKAFSLEAGCAFFLYLCGNFTVGHLSNIRIVCWIRDSFLELIFIPNFISRYSLNNISKKYYLSFIKKNYWFDRV